LNIFKPAEQKQDEFKILADMSFGQEKYKIPVYNYYNFHVLDPNFKYTTQCRRRSQHVGTVRLGMYF
jgi:hypothetical protein